jgi:NAD(P)-dependent dehydrogenase (short-subunit alcohol dehydrogenase family)
MTNTPPTLVLTGSTKGIGYGLAESLLKMGCRVVISGRNPQALERATRALASRYGDSSLAGCLCDVTRPEQVAALWDFAAAKFGKIDIWINNAGAAHPQQALWEIPDETARTIFESNVFGVLNACRVVIPRLMAQGGGQVMNFEGFGSNGRTRPGLGIYGASKSAVAFINKTLAVELKDTPVKVASIQPGMVMTDLVLDQFRDDPASLEKVKPIFNIVASTVDEVAPVLARKILANTKNGAHIQFLSGFGLALRFLTAPFARRDVFRAIDR